MKKSLLFTLGLVSSLALADTVKVQLTALHNQQSMGHITFQDTSHGLEITPKLSHLPTGPHGFHIHQLPSCKNKGMAAGGHFDPKKTGRHLGPFKRGHLGDLPLLIADKNNQAYSQPLLAPRLTVKAMKGHAIMIHAEGDNYADTPNPLGGGGARYACGVM